MLFTNNKSAIKIKSVDLEKGIAIVRFSHASLIVHTMRIVFQDLFGGLVLKHKYRRDTDKFHVPAYQLNEWADYDVIKKGEQ